jgi:hypothetical protein
MPRVHRAKKDESGKTWRYSNFFITINTNRPDYDIEDFHDVLRQIFGDDEKFYHLFTGKTDTVDKAYTDIDYAVEKGSRYVDPETGENMGNVHAHLLIHMRHHSRLAVDIPLLRTVLCRALGLEGLYLQVLGSGDSDATLHDYLRKAPL